MSRPIRVEAVTIAASAAASGAINVEGYRVVAVETPAAWTAGDISFEVSTDSGANFRKVVNRAGALYKLTGVATAAAELNLVSGDANQGDIIITGHSLKVVSTNTASEADVNQDAARTLRVVLVPLS